MYEVGQEPQAFKALNQSGNPAIACPSCQTLVGQKKCELEKVQTFELRTLLVPSLEIPVPSSYRLIQITQSSVFLRTEILVHIQFLTRNWGFKNLLKNFATAQHQNGTKDSRPSSKGELPRKGCCCHSRKGTTCNKGCGQEEHPQEDCLEEGC